MANETIQMKVSGLMCSFCTMSVEKALKRYPGVKSVMVNLVHGIVLVEADTSQMGRPALAEAVEKLGYSVSSTEVQQYATDEALFSLIKRRGMIGMALSILDLIVDPLNLFGLPAYPRALFSLAVAAFVLLWVGYPILRKTLMAVGQRVINANVLLSAGAWGSLVVGPSPSTIPAGRTFCQWPRGSCRFTSSSATSSSTPGEKHPKPFGSFSRSSRPTLVFSAGIRRWTSSQRMLRSASWSSSAPASVSRSTGK